MRGEAASRTRVARFALVLGVGSFVLAAAALAHWQGVPLGSSRACVVVTWAPRSGLPWLFVGALPSLVYALVIRRALRRRPPPVTLGEGPYRQSVLDEPARVDRPRSHLYVRGLLVLLALAAGVAESRRWSCPYAVPASCRPKTSHIAIAAVGKVDDDVVEGLAKHFRDCYGLPVEVAPSIDAPMPRVAGPWWNEQRQQWSAEALLSAMPGCNVEDPLCERDVLVIGVTSADIYTTQESWRYAFTVRDSAHHRVIISTHRMGTFLGTSTENARKIVAKSIALEYCGLPQVTDPRSVRYNGIMGPDNLDAIDESVW
jgi:predicted Zn-dependent protease